MLPNIKTRTDFRMSEQPSDSYERDQIPLIPSAGEHFNLNAPNGTPVICKRNSSQIKGKILSCEHASTSV